MPKPNKPNAPHTTWDAVDSGIADLVGKRVFYQLTDAEGGVPDMRKVVAFVLKTGFDLGGEPGVAKRNGDGKIVSLIWFVNYGGTVIVKEAPLDSAREPGTFDTVKSGDTVT